MLTLTVSDDYLADEECGNFQRRWDKFLDDRKIAAFQNQNLSSFDGTLKLTPISPLHACYLDALLIYTTDLV